MRRNLLICVFMFIASKIEANPDGDCYIHRVGDAAWITAYNNHPVDDFEEKEFKHFVVRNILEVQVQGDDYGKYFDAKLIGALLILSPTPAFKDYEINEKNTLNPEMNVRLHFKCKTGTRQLAFYQPIRDHNTYHPELAQTTFTYTLPMPLPVNFDVSVYGETIIACDMDVSNIRLYFAVNPPKDFSLTWKGAVNDTNKCHRAVLKTTTPLRMSSDTSYRIIVVDHGTPPKSKTASLIVRINQKESLPPNPQFEEAYYTGNYIFQNGEYNIIMDNPIRLRNGCAQVDLQILEYIDNIRVLCEKEEVGVELTEALSDSLLENTVVMLVAIVAIVSRAEQPARTVLVIYVPRKECPQRNLLKSDSLSLNTTTKFPKSFIESDAETYHASVEEFQSKTSIQRNTTNKALKYPTMIETVSSVAIEHVMENEGRLITLLCSCASCTYRIMEQYPDTEPNLFKIHNKTQIYAAPIDREMAAIINMKVSQFMLRLVLTSAANCSRKNHLKSNNAICREWAFLPAKVPQRRDQMLISIIVDDANDHPPVFQEGFKVVVGYPINTIARAVAPLYLTKVTATDLDVGINAEIRYSIDNLNFKVHPITGVVYVGEATIINSDDITIYITARDRNGSDEGLSAKLAIEIKPLTQNHLIVLTLKNITHENLQTSLKLLSNRTTVEIKYLNAARIPVAGSGQSARIIAYGLDSEDNLIEAHVLENALEVCNEDISVDKLDLLDQSVAGNVQTTTNLIVLIAILIILLTLVVNAFVALYCIKIRFEKPAKTRSPKKVEN